MTDDTYGTFAEPTDREAAPARRPRLRRVGTALLATAVLSGAVAVAWVATRSGGGASDRL